MTEKSIGSYVYGPEDTVVSAKIGQPTPTMVFPKTGTRTAPAASLVVLKAAPTLSEKWYENASEMGGPAISLTLQEFNAFPGFDSKKTALYAIKEWTAKGDIPYIPYDLYTAYLAAYGFVHEKGVLLPSDGHDKRVLSPAVNIDGGSIDSDRLWPADQGDGGINRVGSMVDDPICGCYGLTSQTWDHTQNYGWINYDDSTCDVLSTIPYTRMAHAALTSLYYDSSTQSFMADAYRPVVNMYQTVHSASEYQHQSQPYSSYGSFNPYDSCPYPCAPFTYQRNADITLTNIRYIQEEAYASFMKVSLPEDFLLGGDNPNEVYRASFSFSAPSLDALEANGELSGTMTFSMMGTTISVSCTCYVGSNDFSIDAYDPYSIGCDTTELYAGDYISENIADMAEVLWRGSKSVVFAPETYFTRAVKATDITGVVDYYDDDEVLIGTLATHFSLLLPKEYLDAIYLSLSTIEAGAEDFLMYSYPSLDFGPPPPDAELRAMLRDLIGYESMYASEFAYYSPPSTPVPYAHILYTRGHIGDAYIRGSTDAALVSPFGIRSYSEVSDSTWALAHPWGVEGWGGNLQVYSIDAAGMIPGSSAMGVRGYVSVYDTKLPFEQNYCAQYALCTRVGYSWSRTEDRSGYVTNGYPRPTNTYTTYHENSSASYALGNSLLVAPSGAGVIEVELETEVCNTSSSWSGGGGGAAHAPITGEGSGTSKVGRNFSFALVGWGGSGVVSVLDTHVEEESQPSAQTGLHAPSGDGNNEMGPVPIPYVGASSGLGNVPSDVRNRFSFVVGVANQAIALVGNLYLSAGGGQLVCVEENYGTVDWHWQNRETIGTVGMGLSSSYSGTIASTNENGYYGPDNNYAGPDLSYSETTGASSIQGAHLLYKPSIGINKKAVMWRLSGQTGVWKPFIGCSNLEGAAGYVVGAVRLPVADLADHFRTILTSSYAAIIAYFASATSNATYVANTYKRASERDDAALAVSRINSIKQEFIDGSTTREKSGEDPPNTELLYELFISKFLEEVIILRNDFASPELLFHMDRSKIGFGCLRVGEVVSASETKSLWTPG